MLKDVEQLSERINIPKSSTQHASGTINGTNTETSKAKSSEEAHAISLTSIDSVICRRSVSLAFVNRAASFFKCSYCWADAWKCWELGVWHWEQKELRLVSGGQQYGNRVVNANGNASSCEFCTDDA